MKNLVQTIQPTELNASLPIQLGQRLIRAGVYLSSLKSVLPILLVLVSGVISVAAQTPSGSFFDGNSAQLGNSLRSVTFFLAAAMLNGLTLLLAPIALASIVLYSYTKRWTLLSHLVLGWCLAIAPTGAWIAVRGALDSPIPLLLSLVVMLWTAGFDVLYACQDFEFDRREGLYSIPARFGIAQSLWIARTLHAGAFAALVALYFLTNLGAIALLGVIATGALLIYQHTLVRADDLSRLNAAFFTTNAFVSVILFITFGSAVFLTR